MLSSRPDARAEPDCLAALRDGVDRGRGPAVLRGQPRGGPAVPAGEFTLKSPMPGLIVAIPVNEGDAVKKGQTLIVLESMKMENELKAPHDGTVGSIKVKLRQSVDQHQALLVVL